MRTLTRFIVIHHRVDHQELIKPPRVTSAQGPQCPPSAVHTISTASAQGHPHPRTSTPAGQDRGCPARPPSGPAISPRPARTHQVRPPHGISRRAIEAHSQPICTPSARHGHRGPRPKTLCENQARAITRGIAGDAQHPEQLDLDVPRGCLTDQVTQATVRGWWSCAWEVGKSAVGWDWCMVRCW